MTVPNAENATERATEATAATTPAPAIPPAHKAFVSTSSSSLHIRPRLGAVKKSIAIPTVLLVSVLLLTMTSSSAAKVAPGSQDTSFPLHCHQPNDGGYGYISNGDGSDQHELLDVVDVLGGAAASCGGCYCIPDDDNGTCPSNGPPERYPRGVLNALSRQRPNAIYTIDCNPYEEGTNCTVTPPSTATAMATTTLAGAEAEAEGLELDSGGRASSGNTSGLVCGLKYDYDQNSMATPSFLGLEEGEGTKNCPKTYDMVTYPTWAEAEADGAFVTHTGACGVCSTTQDLAAYMANIDMTSKGTKCGIVTTVAGTDAGVRCYRKLGLTKECAKIWVYDSLNTNQYCHETCIKKTFERQCNNGAPPTCELNNCLQCDEDESGPIFKSVAGRTRRRSAVLSSIARPCSSIAPIVQDACPPPPQKRVPQ